MNLWSLFRRYASPMIIILSMALGALSGVTGSAILQIVKEALYNKDPGLTLKLVLYFAGLCLVTGVSRYASSLVLVVLGARSVASLQRDLSRKILGSPMRRLEELGPHRMIAALTSDIASITNAVTNIPVLFINAATVVGCIVYMTWLSWREMIIVAIAMIVGIPTYLAAIKAGSRRHRLAREVEDDLFKYFRGATQGTKELKMRRRRREDFLAQLEATAERYRDLRIVLMRVFLGAASWGNLLFYIAIGVVLFAPGVSPGSTKTAYVLSLLYIMGPLQLLLNSFPMLTQANIAVQKIERLGLSLVSESAEAAADADHAPATTWESLELKGVVLSYPPQEAEESRFTLGPIDLSIRPGEIVFLAGGNGSGKTTLAKVLIGLYPPDSGEILFNGVPVTDETRDAYRQNFAVVFADFFLFDALLGFDTPEHEALARRYLADLRLKHKVRIANGKLSTIELSQGQRKRLALLMAFLEDSPFFLFDEWAADQDPEFRSFFYCHLLPQLRDRGKTVVVISHDERFFHVGDRVVCLDCGKVVEDRPLVAAEYATA
jgi:putative ATP-binding cassette transporter